MSNINYFKIDRNDEGQKCLYENFGFFNFWNEYLVLKVQGEEKPVFFVLVNSEGEPLKYDVIHKKDTYALETAKEMLTSLFEELSNPKILSDFPEVANLIK